MIVMLFAMLYETVYTNVQPAARDMVISSCELLLYFH